MSGAVLPGDSSRRIARITLDESSIGRSGPEIEHERRIAIYDLLEDNIFALRDHEGGPYALHLAIVEKRLVIEINLTDGARVMAHHLSLTPFRRIVKDYLMVCDNYYRAIQTASPSQIEAIDMGRRALHNEGSELLMARLKDKIDMDFDTARRLFTLISVLHWKG